MIENIIIKLTSDRHRERFTEIYKYYVPTVLGKRFYPCTGTLINNFVIAPANYYDDNNYHNLRYLL